MPSDPVIEDHDPNRVEAPSKTQAKQHSHALQKLGLALCELPEGRLDALQLPERLRDAIAEYGRTRSHEGRRRQLQYVGKLMRGVDETPLREAVAEASVGSARDTLLLHQAEAWRDRLIATDEALTQWIDTHPACDAQRLRSLVRAARREAALPPDRRNLYSYRELFQFVRPALADEAS